MKMYCYTIFFFSFIEVLQPSFNCEEAIQHAEVGKVEKQKKS